MTRAEQKKRGLRNQFGLKGLYNILKLLRMWSSSTLSSFQSANDLYRFRRRCNEAVEHPTFDKFILLLIALNCITLAMERPSIPSDSPERLFLSISNDLFTVLFLIEMSLKVVAQGGFAQYFESGWNIMDGILVLISVVDQVISVFMNR